MIATLSLLTTTLALGYTTVETTNAADGRRRSELLSDAETAALGVTLRGNKTKEGKNSHDLLPEVADMPADFTWGDIKGTNFLTPSLNQHIPQYAASRRPCEILSARACTACA